MERILVVDDDERSRKLLKDFLEMKGYSVVTAGGGREALEKIEDEAGLVLLDIMMPDMHGLEVLDKIKERRPSMDVIMVTALNDHDIGMQSLSRGAYDYVTKPIDLDHLERLVDFKSFQMIDE
jgi:DNA-binding NtrC family response regulator